MTPARARVERTLIDKRYVRYKDGAKMYNMGLSKFQEMAREANAVIKYGKIVLVDRVAIEEYLETFWEFA